MAMPSSLVTAPCGFLFVYVLHFTRVLMIYWFYNIKKVYGTTGNIYENNENYDSNKCELLERNV